MSVGIITSPATWASGTVLSPQWAQQVQDNINAMMAGFFGDGSDGDVTVSGATSLTRDMYYGSLTLANGGTFATNGYKVFCRTSFTAATGSSMSCVPGVLTSLLGGPYGVGGSTDGGAATSVYYYSFGASGGLGGSSPTGIAGNNSLGGGIGHPSANIVAQGTTVVNGAVTPLAGGGGGGGGAGGVGTGGRGGSGGGLILICSPVLNLDGGTAIVNGGAGVNAPTANSGGGGGGGGGSVVFVYISKTGSMTVTATGGTPGTGNGTGSAGLVGSNGSSAPVFFQLA